MKAKKDRVYKEAPTLPSLVPPWLAAILSAVIPGLGQALGRAIKRGIIIFTSFANSCRVADLAFSSCCTS